VQGDSFHVLNCLCTVFVNYYRSINTILIWWNPTSLEAIWKFYDKKISIKLIVVLWYNSSIIVRVKTWYYVFKVDLKLKFLTCSDTILITETNMLNTLCSDKIPNVFGFVKNQSIYQLTFTKNYEYGGNRSLGFQTRSIPCVSVNNNKFFVFAK
jgi:hypothetical protein